MKKRVIIVHGWDGTQESNWFPWLKRELESRGFTVTVPRLPNPGTPRIEAWVPVLAKTAGTVDEDTYLVGHSMGCQTILRFLAGLHGTQRAGGALLVAGFMHLTGLSPEEEVIWKPWDSTPPDLANARAHCERFAAIFSDDDPFVPLTNAEVFQREIGANTLTLHARGHFSENDGATRLPEALDAILTMAGRNPA